MEYLKFDTVGTDVARCQIESYEERPIQPSLQLLVPAVQSWMMLCAQSVLPLEGEIDKKIVSQVSMEDGKRKLFEKVC